LAAGAEKDAKDVVRGEGRERMRDDDTEGKMGATHLFVPSFFAFCVRIFSRLLHLQNFRCTNVREMGIVHTSKRGWKISVTYTVRREL